MSEAFYVDNTRVDSDDIQNLLTSKLKNYSMIENPIRINGKRFCPQQSDYIDIDFYYNPDTEDYQSEIMIRVSDKASDSQKNLALHIKKLFVEKFGEVYIHQSSFVGGKPNV